MNFFFFDFREAGIVRCFKVNTLSCWLLSKSWGKRLDLFMRGVRARWRDLNVVSRLVLFDGYFDRVCFVVG